MISVSCLQQVVCTRTMVNVYTVYNNWEEISMAKYLKIMNENHNESGKEDTHNSPHIKGK